MESVCSSRNQVKKERGSPPLSERGTLALASWNAPHEKPHHALIIYHAFGYVDSALLRGASN
jgi:hypothetical protein